MSPKVGSLDEAAFDDELRRSPDEALSLLADLTGATDPALRELARRLAGRVVLRLGRGGPVRARGVGRLRPSRLDGGGDLDVDASLDAILAGTASGTGASLDDLRSRSWARPSTAVCLVVDRSGSMGGARLATAALAASAVAFRAPEDHSVIAFADDVVVLKAQDARRPAEQVVDDLLALRGHGPTDLALGLRAARAQLDRSTAANRAVVLLSDGRPTKGDDPAPAARAVESLYVLAPAGDADDARDLAAAAGGRCVEVGGPSGVAAALAALVGG